MAQSARMDGHKSVHSLIGGLAQALKGFSMPRSSIYISQELKKLSEEIKKEKNNVLSSDNVLVSPPFAKKNSENDLPFSIESREKVCSSASKKQSENTSSNLDIGMPSNPNTLSTPSCSTAQIDSSSALIVTNPPCIDSAHRISSNINCVTQPNHFPSNPRNSVSCASSSISSTGYPFTQTITSFSAQIQPNSESDILYQPESLLKLLSDDTDLLPHSSMVSKESHCSEYRQPAQESSPPPEPILGSAILRIPEYLKAPARIFPMIIGSETYALPYQDNGSTVVVTLNVVHAAGEYIVAKVTGCCPFDSSTPYPEGILLTLSDEIKVLHTKSFSEMTIAEQIHYHSLKVCHLILIMFEHYSLNCP